MQCKKYRYGYDEDKLNDIFQKVNARRKQIEILLKLFGPANTFATQSIFIYGHAATGKSLTVLTIMQQFQLLHVWINCIEMHNPRYLFEAILKNISKLLNVCENNTKHHHCDNMCDFLYELKMLLKNSDETIYIILDKAEILRSFNHSILSTFLKLQELIQMNVCIIFISEIVWEKFQKSTTTYEPYIVHFPDYNKDELLSIMALKNPTDISQEFYIAYLKMVLGVFYIITKNLKELEYLANLNIFKYIEYINSGEVNATDVHKLWKNIEPYLKNSLNTVYIREISSQKWEVETKNPKQVAIPKKATELPFYSKFLLIASYLASYNPPKTDKKYFIKKKENRVCRKRVLKKEKRLTNHLIGPKPFPLERMLAIFTSIIEENVPPKAIIFSQIASLVSLKLLACSTHPEEISSPKYKCLATLSLITNIGRIVDFDVLHYLDDFF